MDHFTPLSAMQPLMPEIDFAYDELPNLHELFPLLREHGPVVPVRYLGAPVWLILGYATLEQAFNDYEHFEPSGGYQLISEPSMGRTIQTLPPDEHRVDRTLVNPLFTPAKVRSYVEAPILPALYGLCDAIEGRQEVEFISEFLHSFPFRVITLLLGIPVEDEGLFLKWISKMLDYPWDPEGAVAAKDAFFAYAQKIIDARRKEPRDDFITYLTRAEYDGQRLSDERILAFLGMLFPAGSDTTYRALGSLFAKVLEKPEFIAMAKSSKRERDMLVSEAVRWQNPTALLPRLASADGELGGVHVAKGDWMLFGITAANNDPAVFENPRVFDPFRPNLHQILSFGRNRHVCLGMHLARRNMELALRVVFERFPDIRLKPGFEIQYSSAVLRGAKSIMVEPYGGKTPGGRA